MLSINPHHRPRRIAHTLAFSRYPSRSRQLVHCIRRRSDQRPPLLKALPAARPLRPSPLSSPSFASLARIPSPQKAVPSPSLVVCRFKHLCPYPHPLPPRDTVSPPRPLNCRCLRPPKSLLAATCRHRTARYTSLHPLVAIAHADVNARLLRCILAIRGQSPSPRITVVNLRDSAIDTNSSSPLVPLPNPNARSTTR